MPEPLASRLSPTLREHQRARAGRVVAALDRLSPGWSGRRRLRVEPKVEHALLHHTLYETRRAARERSLLRARVALAVWEREEIPWAPIVSTAVGPVMAMPASSCRRSEDDHFLSPLYTVTGEPAGFLGPLPRRLVEQGARHVVEAGLGDCPSAALGAVVLLDWRPGSGTTHSYSVTALPGTAFTDWTDDAVRWGEILLHESSHSWLNQCLGALGVRLPDQPTWFSEWKQQQRPAYGILHAAFAFSLMLRYFGHFAGGAAPSEAARRYCAARLEPERAVLARMAPAVRQAAAFLSHEGLRTAVVDQVEHALGSSPEASATRP